MPLLHRCYLQCRGSPLWWWLTERRPDDDCALESARHRRARAHSCVGTKSRWRCAFLSVISTVALSVCRFMISTLINSRMLAYTKIMEMHVVYPKRYFVMTVCLSVCIKNRLMHAYPNYVTVSYLTVVFQTLYQVAVLVTFPRNNEFANGLLAVCLLSHQRCP